MQLRDAYLDQEVSDLAAQINKQPHLLALHRADGYKLSVYPYRDSCDAKVDINHWLYVHVQVSTTPHRFTYFICDEVYTSREAVISAITAAFSRIRLLGRGL